MDIAQIEKRLSGLTIPQVRYLQSTASTNADALTWAEAGAPDGALVVADEQTAGRGRLNRHWVTRAGAALAFSLVLRPSADESPHAALFSALGGLAVQSALAQDFGLQAQVKWPNDVLVGGRKVCGVLVESIWTGEVPACVVVGIGINITPDALPPSEQLLFPATCLEAETGHTLDRLDVLASVLQQFFAWRPQLGSAQLIHAWQERLAYRGESVRLDAAMGGQATVGVLLGLNSAGDLRLRLADGTEIAVNAGELSLRLN